MIHEIIGELQPELDCSHLYICWCFQILAVDTWGRYGCQSYAPAAFTPQEIFLVLICIRGWVELMAKVRPEGLCHWKLPVTQMTRVLPACSAVPLSTAPPRAPYLYLPHKSIYKAYYPFSCQSRSVSRKVIVIVSNVKYKKMFFYEVTVKFISLNVHWFESNWIFSPFCYECRLQSGKPQLSIRTIA